MRDGTDLKGIIAAAITPATAGGEIDVPRLDRHCRNLLSQGCSFVSSFGTTGEGASLSARQKVAALAALSARGFPMDRQIPAVMATSVDEGAELLSAIARLGCRAALILPPFYYGSAGDQGIAGYFDALLARAGHPPTDLLLYNIPAMSRISFTPSLVALLVERLGERIVGIKDSTGDIDNGVTLARSFPGLSVFTGDDRVLPHLLRAGGAGLIGGMPNLFASDLVTLVSDPDGEGAGSIIRRSGERIVEIDGNGALLALKAMLARRYNDSDFARAFPPLVALDSARADRVAEALARIADSSTPTGP